MFKLEIDRIKKNVHKENELRKVLNRESARIIEVLTPFIGQKITKADETFTKKVEDLINYNREAEVQPFKKGDYARIHVLYCNIGSCCIYLRASICFNGGSHDVAPSTAYCEYKDDSYYIARIDNHVLTEVKALDLKPVDLQQEIANYDRACELYEELGKVSGLLLDEHQKTVS